MLIRPTIALLLASLIWLSATPAQAHFLWLLQAKSASGTPVVQAHFSEAADDPEPELLKRLDGLQVWYRPTTGDLQALTVKPTPEALEIALPAQIDAQHPGVVLTEKNFGVSGRGDVKFLLQYYAKLYPGSVTDAAQLGATKQLRLDIVPVIDGQKLKLHVTWEGKPVADSEVVVKGPGLKGDKIKTDAQGLVAVDLAEAGLLEIRARHIEARGGKLDDKEYTEVRHYCTVTLPWAGVEKKTASVAAPAARELPLLPEGLTSFGAAVHGEWLYVYGGHLAKPHQYSMETQSPRLRRVNLNTPTAWEDLASGPRLQGVAMITCGDRLVRIGGFSAHNAIGEKQNLWSVSEVAAYNPASNQWSSLPPLPAPRSSHDAAVIGNTIYVAGGWQLRGSDAKPTWHDTAWSLDLSAATPAWQPLAAPPFQRRAVAVAALAGKLYVIGGMESDNGMTTEVAVYDPASRAWASAPDLPGEDSEGFGASAFAVENRLCVSTRNGQILSLQSGADKWETLGTLKHPRFFHRLLAGLHQDVIVVGGSGADKVKELEVVAVSK